MMAAPAEDRSGCSYPEASAAHRVGDGFRIWRIKMKLRLLFVGVCLSLLARTAQAVPITFSLGSSLLTTTPGTTVTFTGTLTEIGGSTTFLNGDTFNATQPLIVNDTAFFLNFPLALSPLQTFTAAMFMVTVPAGT